jgi:signal transduction histidine kinase
MLDIAKLESGKQSFLEENLEIHEFLNDCYEETSQLYKQKRQTFELDVRFEKLIIKTDRNKFLQVMINLLGNAHKFTPEGGTIKILAEVNDKNILSIHVKDNGM